MEKSSKEPNDKKAESTSLKSSGNLKELFDRTFKQCLKISSSLTVMLINELFKKDYPLDSKVEFLNTEEINTRFEKTISDAFIRINDKDLYVMEITSYYDPEIMRRVLNYCIYPALDNFKAITGFIAPSPVLIILYDRVNYPESMQCPFDMPGLKPGPVDEWEFPVFALLNNDWVEEKLINLVALTPFQLLRLRKAIREEGPEKNAAALDELVKSVMKTIDTCMDRNILSDAEATALTELFAAMYDYLYGRYPELNRTKGARDEMEQVVDLRIFRVIEEQEKLKEEAVSEVTEKFMEEISQKDAEISRLESLLISAGIPFDESLT